MLLMQGSKNSVSLPQENESYLIERMHVVKEIIEVHLVCCFQLGIILSKILL